MHTQIIKNQISRIAHSRILPLVFQSIYSIV